MRKSPISAEEQDKLAITMTRMERWLPSIKDRALELGIKSYRQLWQRVEPFKSSYPDFFDSVTYWETSMVVQGDIRHIFLSQSNDYRNIAYAVALALDTTAEDLFGPVPHHAPGPKPSENYILNTLSCADSFRQQYLMAAAGNPLTACLSREFKKSLHQEIDARLDARQAQMVKDYYGFSDHPKTYQEIAHDWNCSLERVRQIISQSQSILSKSRLLKKYNVSA